jgi:hypothetical protein
MNLFANAVVARTPRLPQTQWDRSRTVNTTHTAASRLGGLVVPGSRLFSMGTKEIDPPPSPLRTSMNPDIAEAK